METSIAALSSMMALLLFSAFSAAHAAAPVKAAYYYSGSAVSASDVDATLFTHLFYAFASMDATTFTVAPAAGDETTLASFSPAVKATNPAVKTLLSIGGGGSNATAFAVMASTAASRAAFINSSIAAARQYGFDGLDLDWEFPRSTTDMDNLATLLSEWRAKSSPLLLTAAVHYNVTLRLDGLGARSYPTSAIAEYLDFVTVMAYDLHGSWETTQTAEHTALYDSTSDQILTVNYGVRHWLDAGLPPSRASLGLAAYGYRWFLQNPSSDIGVGAAATGSDSTSTFSDIMSDVQSYNGTCSDDNTTVAAYCYWTVPSSGQTLWAGFDDPATIAAKVGYLKSNQLLGYSFWSVAGDTKNLLFQQASNTLTSRK